jgi:hypothetical protein
MRLPDQIPSLTPYGWPQSLTLGLVILGEDIEFRKRMFATERANGEKAENTLRAFTRL